MTFKKLVATLLIGFFSTAAAAEELTLDCSFISDSDRETRVQASSDEFTFAEAFAGLFKPTTSLLTGDQPQYYVLTDATATTGDEARTFNLFVSEWVAAENLSEEAVAILGQLGLDADAVTSVRVAFPTDLFQTLVYAELQLVDGTTVKTAIGGLSIGVCQ